MREFSRESVSQVVFVF